MSTFLQLHGKKVQLLHPLLQLVLCGGRHGVDVIVAPVVVLVGVGGEDLRTSRGVFTQLPIHFQTLDLQFKIQTKWELRNSEAQHSTRFYLSSICSNQD